MYPGCAVHLYGSTVNGLGFKGCDIDAFIDLGLTVEERTSRGTSSTSISRADQKNACDKITKQLRTQHSNVVGNVTGIPAARVPIVKFIHLKSGLSVDLSFKNKTAVMNTEFIRCCVNADSRVRIVMVSVRCWASIYGLSGGGHGGRTWKITNYALTLLIIFYLQVEGILPSVKSLQELMTDGDSCIIDGWECGYLSDFSNWQSKKQQSKTFASEKSPMELLHGV